MTGIRMNDEVRTARQNFDAVMANPARARFDFGERLAIVNVDFQNGQTRIDRYATAYSDRCAIEARRCWRPCRLCHELRLGGAFSGHGAPH